MDDIFLTRKCIDSAKAIADNISRRTGLRDEWDGILPDQQSRIINNWSMIIFNQMKDFLAGIEIDVEEKDGI